MNPYDNDEYDEYDESMYDYYECEDEVVGYRCGWYLGKAQSGKLYFKQWTATIYRGLDIGMCPHTVESFSMDELENDYRENLIKIGIPMQPGTEIELTVYDLEGDDDADDIDADIDMNVIPF